ncbi:MAG: hypothetical protein N2037_07445 [Acidimicrobiales bacterium]|nr:hypothetical protein [Acidimicrobiales bacterium]
MLKRSSHIAAAGLLLALCAAALGCASSGATEDAHQVWSDVAASDGQSVSTAPGDTSATSVFTSVLGITTVPQPRNVEASGKPRVAVVGDSLTLTATTDLLLRFQLAGWDPVTIDGAAGQPIATRVTRVRELVASGDLDALVIALGSNDARLIVDSGQDVSAAWRVTQASAFTALAEAQAVPCVIWVGVNTNTTRWNLDTWGAWFNNWVRYYAKFADWSVYARGHDDWFLLDGVHLSAEGNAQYAKLIVDTVVEQCR